MVVCFVPDFHIEVDVRDHRPAVDRVREAAELLVRRTPVGATATDEERVGDGEVLQFTREVGEDTARLGGVTHVLDSVKTRERVALTVKSTLEVCDRGVGVGRSHREGSSATRNRNTQVRAGVQVDVARETEDDAFAVVSGIRVDLRDEVCEIICARNVEHGAREVVRACREGTDRGVRRQRQRLVAAQEVGRNVRADGGHRVVEPAGNRSRSLRRAVAVGHRDGGVIRARANCVPTVTVAVDAGCGRRTAGEVGDHGTVVEVVREVCVALEQRSDTAEVDVRVACGRIAHRALTVQRNEHAGEDAAFHG